jgi:hypothetical protein
MAFFKIFALNLGGIFSKKKFFLHDKNGYIISYGFLLLLFSEGKSLVIFIHFLVKNNPMQKTNVFYWL